MGASEWIDLVIKRAPELRRVGVTSIGVDGCTVTLGPEPYAGDDKGKSDEPTPPKNYMEDPASYVDGVVPGFEIEPLEGQR